MKLLDKMKISSEIKENNQRVEKAKSVMKMRKHTETW
jgi:hypothetical protein